MRLVNCLPLALLLCAACQSADAPAPAPDSTTAVPPAAPPPPNTAGWVLDPDGLGAARVGLTPDALRGAGLTVEEDTVHFEPTCYYARIAEAPDSVFFMIEEGTLARVDVQSRQVKTADGLGVGDTEQAILARYPDARVEPHKYTDGHYLVVPVSEGARAIVFETDGARVTEYRAGRQPAVEYVEGCS